MALSRVYLPEDIIFYKQEEVRLICVYCLSPLAFFTDEVHEQSSKLNAIRINVDRWLHIRKVSYLFLRLLLEKHINPISRQKSLIKLVNLLFFEFLWKIELFLQAKGWLVIQTKHSQLFT